MKIRRKNIVRSIPLLLIMLVLLGGWWFVDSLAYGNASSLHRAIMQRNLGRAESLIRHGADVRAKMYAGLYPNTWNATPLHLAASGNLVQLVAPLLNAGAEIDALDKLGYTPLLQALRCGSNETAQALVRAGAQVHLSPQSGQAAFAQENYGQPLQAALQHDSIETVKYLIEHGANPQTDIGPAAAAWADKPDLLQKFELLASLGCSMNEASKRSTPLITAAEADDVKSIEFLLAHGADIQKPGGYDSLTPLEAATRRGSTNSMKTLVAHGGTSRESPPP